MGAVLIASTAVLGLAACGAEEPAEPQPVVEQPGVETPAYPPVPTPDELNAEVARGFDPAVPLEDKTTFVQGAEEDPQLIDEVVAAAIANDATIEITSIDDLGDGTLSGGATLTVAGQANPATIIFVAEDGVWKMSRDNACAIVDIAGLSSTACA